MEICTYRVLAQVFPEADDPASASQPGTGTQNILYINIRYMYKFRPYFITYVIHYYANIYI